MDDRSPFERSVWLLLDLLDIKSQLNWHPTNRGRALDVCVDSLRVSLASVRHTLTTQQPSQLLLELAIHATHGYGDGGDNIATAIDFGSGQLRDAAYGDGLATWIADLLAELVRRAASPDRGVWEQVITNLEAAVERVDLIATSISRWEVLAEQPLTEMALLELMDGVRLFAPPLALASALDAFLKREVMAVIEPGTTTLQRQMPRIMTALLAVREQLTGVHMALRDGMDQREANLHMGSGARSYESIA